MKIKIRLSEKLSECPNVLKGSFYHFGCKSENAWRGFIQDFTPRTTCHFNELEFIPEEDLLQQTEWVIEAQESESVAVLLINGRPVAATIHSQIRGTDGRISGKADLSDQCIGGVLKSLPGEIRHLGIFSFAMLQDINPLGDRRDLLTLSLAQCGGIRDISPLRALENLCELDLSDLRRLEDINALKNVGTLRRLALNGCSELEKITAVAECRNLESLDLSCCLELKSLEPLRRLIKLRHLNLFQCSKVEDFSPIASLCSLEKLKVAGHAIFNDHGYLKTLTELIELNVTRGIDLSRGGSWPDSHPSPTHLGALSTLKKLQILEVESWERLEDITALADCRELEHLNLGHCSALKNLAPLTGLPKLATLGIADCENLKDLSPLGQIPQLVSLSGFRMPGHANFSGCKSIENLAPLSNLTWITDLDLEGCRSLTNLEPLSSLSNLKVLDLDGCSRILDLAPLESLKNLKKINLEGVNRLKSIEPLRQIATLSELECDFHPALVAEILAYTAWLRRDLAMIEKRGWDWGKEAMTCEKHRDNNLEKLTTSLCLAFSLLGQSKLAAPMETLLGRHPEFSTAPWKAWFGGTFKESGFDLYRQRVERVPVAQMLAGAIGGACASLPHETHADWSRQWLTALESARLSDAKNLITVAPEICLAHARLGLSELLHSWLLAFTDPSDPSAIDPVHAALARFQLANQHLEAAESHLFAIQSPSLRDPTLAELVVALAANDPEGASARLLLIENPATRTNMAKSLATNAGFSASEAALHRLVVAMGDSPEALGELISSLPETSTESLLIQKISESLRLDRQSTLRKIAEELHRQAGRIMDQTLKN